MRRIMGENIMSKNEQIYKNWIKQIDKFDKLSFADAKKLYQKMLEVDDEDKKQEYFNRLIEGTIYVVAEFIKNNKFASIDNVNFDMDDVINSCSEIWIRRIKEGSLLVKRSLYKILDVTFYNELSRMLIETDLTVADVTIASTLTLSDLLYLYIEFTQKNGEASYEDFLKIISEYFKEAPAYYKISSRLNALGFSDIDLVEQTYELFEAIIEYSSDSNNNISYTKRKLDMLKYILLDTGLQRFRINLDDVYKKDDADIVVEEIIYKELIDAINNCSSLSDRDREIVFRITGSNGEEKITYDEAAKIYGVSEARIGQLYHKALRLIRTDYDVRKCLKQMNLN